ncbi:MAG: OFA family MFS transporter [Candidatus Hadarchaeota archaeon]
MSTQEVDKFQVRNRWLVLLAAFLAMCLVSPFEYVWSSVSPLMAEANAWSPDRLGLIFTFFVLFQSGASFPTGYLRDIYGPRLLTMVGGVLAAAGIYSLSFDSFVLVLFFYGILGSFGAGMIYSNAVNTGNKWFPERRGLTTGFTAAAFSWGSIPFIFWIRKSADVGNYGGILSWIALIVLFVTLVAGYFMRDPPVDLDSENGVSFTGENLERPSRRQFGLGKTVMTWQFWVLYLAFFLTSGSGLMTISKIVEYSASIGFVPAIGTVAAAGLALTNGGGRVVVGRISDKFGYENAMIMSFTLFGAFLLVMGLTNSSVIFLGSTLTALFFWGALFSLFPAIVGHYYGRKHSAGNYGLLYSAKMLGGVYGGYVSAVVVSGYGFRTAFVVGGLMGLVAAALIIPTKYSPPE